MDERPDFIQAELPGRNMQRRAACLLGLVLITASGIATALAQNGPQGAVSEGQRLFRADCAGCHKWHGGGGGGYGGAALSLRETQLDSAQIIATIGCGRPGTGMPYRLRDAYTPDHPCYGMKSKAELGANAPPEADSFLRPSEIAALADYVIADIKGRGQPTLAECKCFLRLGVACVRRV